MASKRKHTMSSSKKRTQTMPSGLIFDINISFVMIAVFAYLYIVVLPLGALPKEWLILGGLIGIIVLLVNLILSLVKLPSIVNILRRVVVVALCGLITFGAFSISRLDSAMEEVIKMPTSYKEYVSVITLRDSKIIDSADLKNKYI